MTRAAGATPNVGIEPWHAGPAWDQTPSFPDIASNADSADTDCTLDGSSYDTSCTTWLASIGRPSGNSPGIRLMEPVRFREAGGTSGWPTQLTRPPSLPGCPAIGTRCSRK
jgi:hypothetical protein